MIEALDPPGEKSGRWIWRLFNVTGNSEEFPVTLKGTNVQKMRTRVKMQLVASDRARRENVKAVTGPSPEKYDVPLNILQ